MPGFGPEFIFKDTKPNMGQVGLVATTLRCAQSLLHRDNDYRHTRGARGPAGTCSGAGCGALLLEAVDFEAHGCNKHLIHFDQRFWPCVPSCC